LKVLKKKSEEEEMKRRICQLSLSLHWPEHHFVKKKGVMELQ
jgi:hypothetical protein